MTNTIEICFMAYALWNNSTIPNYAYFMARHGMALASVCGAMLYEDGTCDRIVS